MSAIHTVLIDGINYDVKATHYATCPSEANAVEKIKNIPDIKIMNSKGGDGAVREFIDKYILK